MRARLGFEQMHNNVAGIDQYPVAGFAAFHRHMLKACLVQRFLHAVSKAAHVALRSAGGDNHTVCEIGFAFEVNNDGLFSFEIVEGFGDEFLELGDGGKCFIRCENSLVLLLLRVLRQSLNDFHYALKTPFFQVYFVSSSKKAGVCGWPDNKWRGGRR